MPNESIHQDIEAWLAADVHDQLTSSEKETLQQHLATCGSCRALHQEEKAMHQLLGKTLTPESADPAFADKMVRRFRDRTPERAPGFGSFFTSLLRMRAAQITAIAALLLTLIQVGKFVTREGSDAQMARAEMATTAAPPPRHRAFDKASGPTGDMSTSVAESFDAAALPAPQESKLAAAVAPSESAPFTQSESVPGADERAATKMQAKPTNELAEPMAENVPEPVAPPDSRKLVRNAQLDLLVASFEAAIQRLTTLAGEEKGFIATQSSEKLPNGKLQGTVVVKVAPDHLDAFLQKARGLGELKNQTLGTEDVTKAYFDTDARLRNAKRMEDRLLEMLQKNTGKVSDLLQVEKELARVREQIEKMQGELKYYDALVQYATVTVTLAEKDLDEPAAFLLKETANLSLFSTDVAKTFTEVKNALRNAKAQIVQSTLDRDNSGQATARITLLLAPEESDSIITQIKGMGRVQNFNVQTERVAQNGSGMSETAKVERDKVQLNLVISRYGEEPSVQQTSLRILTNAVGEKVAQLKASVAQAGGELRSSTFSRNPDGQEVATIGLRVPLKKYAGLVDSFDRLGEVKDLSVQRNDQPGATANPETAPADISLQIYSRGQIVSDQNSLAATIRRTLVQGLAALMWSARMIGVALAFLAPWGLALGLVSWVVIRFARRM